MSDEQAHHRRREEQQGESQALGGEEPEEEKGDGGEDAFQGPQQAESGAGIILGVAPFLGVEGEGGPEMVVRP